MSIVAAGNPGKTSERPPEETEKREAPPAKK